MNKKQIYGLRNFIVDSDMLPSRAIEKWFEQNPVESVVGLSDEQVQNLARALNYRKYWKHDWLTSTIHDFLKTQTFAQPQQYFEPSWEIIPNHVDEVEIVMNYCQDGMVLDDESNFLISYKRPVPPAPRVEVGQIWNYKDNTYVVTGIERIKGKTKIGTEWVDDLELVHYHRGTNLVSIEFQAYTRTMDAFLAKFEQVQP
jgi:intein/homing endonuclease